ncbi:MAG: penicillin-binding protein 1C [Fibrobacter sp.]|nr:penicillin-binding protein 1C [Fibrobacter sp.]
MNLRNVKEFILRASDGLRKGQPRWIASAAALSLLLLFVLWCLIPVPSRLLDGYSQSWLLYSRDGKLIREAVSTSGTRATWIPIDTIAQSLSDAIVAIEDKRFFYHPGIDPIAAARSLVQLFNRSATSSGASTITMQTARMLYKCPRSLSGKLLQCLYALRLERTLSKREILEQYLNRAEFGAGCMGVEAASRRFFGKSARDITTAEAALLAALPQAPTAYNPLKDPAKARERQSRILQKMLRRAKLSEEEFKLASEEEVRIGGFLPRLHAMHFTDFVLSQSPEPGKIITTLDLNLQTYLEKLVSDHVSSLKRDGLTNAAVVVLDNNDGGILAMAGSADYWSEPSGSVNGAVSLRQPGSTLKPFTYALAFENGKTPASIVADIETEYIGSKGELFSPKNYSHTFNGPVLMREALGRSLNVPAIRTLNFAGLETFLDRLHQAGFKSLSRDANYYGLGITLGNGEVTLLELAQGYAMFARGGYPVTAKAVMDQKIEPGKKRVFSEQISFLITDILSDDLLRIQAFGAVNPLLFDFPFAIKTGTSANWRDSWAVGYCKDFTLAVWAGDFEGATMDRVSGSIGAGPLFNKVLNLMVYGNSVPRIPVMPKPPAGVEQITVCPLSGMTPGEYCPSSRPAFVLAEKNVRPVCDVHRKIRIDKRNGLLASGNCPSRFTEERVFAVLPSRFAQWQAENGSLPVPPHSYSPLCPQGGITANALVITSPRPGEKYLIEPGYSMATQSIALKGECDPPLPDVNWEVDGKIVAKAKWPYTADWKLSKGKHVIRMSGGGMKSDPVEIEVR